MGRFSLLTFTYVVIITCLLGVNFFAINLGVFQLSTYRVLVVLSLFILPNILKACKIQIQKGASFEYIYFMVFWIIFSFLPVLWINDYGAWVKAMFFLFTGLISSLLIFGFLNDKIKVIKAIELIVFVSFLYFFLAFYEMFTANYLFVTEKNLSYYQEFSLLHSATGFREPVTVFGNPNNYSLFLFFTIVFALFLYNKSEKRHVKIFYILVVFVSFFLIICTQSRSGFIGACVFFLVYSLLTFVKKPLVFKLKVLLVLVVLGALMIPKLLEYLDFFNDVATINLNNEGSSDSIRKNLIKNGFVFLFETFFLGVGLGNIEFYMGKFHIYNTEDIVNMHNWWMEVLVSSGLFVFAYYMLVYIRSMYRMFRASKLVKDPRIKNTYSILFSCFVGFIVASIGASSLIECEWYWALMAICMKASTINFS